MLFIKNHYHYYKKFEDELSDIEGLNVIPISSQFLAEKNLEKIYSDDNEYGGHFSKIGNELTAEIIHNHLKKIKTFD